jgi:polyphosphate kinase 2 (PPK2 family)
MVQSNPEAPAATETEIAQDGGNTAAGTATAAAEDKPEHPTDAAHLIMESSGSLGAPAAAAERRTASELRRDAAAIRESFETGVFPYKVRMTEKGYLQHMLPLQVELLKLQNWVKETRQKASWCSSKAAMPPARAAPSSASWSISIPRGARVVALEKPTEIERTQWYFQRYIQQSAVGRRNRVLRPLLVQPRRRRACHGLLLAQRVSRIHAPDARRLERMLVRSGVSLFKFWFSVTREEQYRRFQIARARSAEAVEAQPIDRPRLDKWDAYTEAKEAMFFYTDTADAPWTVIKSDDKRRARLNAMQHFLSSFGYPDRDPRVVHGPDQLIVGSSAAVLGLDQGLFGRATHPELKRGS